MYDYERDKEEGFTGVYNRTPWVWKFAIWPFKHFDEWVWWEGYRVKEYSAFGINQRDIWLDRWGECNR